MPKTWICPFYQRAQTGVVSCEGGRMDFPSEDAFNDYTRRFCANNPGWRRCTIAQSLGRYYEREIEDEERAKE